MVQKSRDCNMLNTNKLCYAASSLWLTYASLFSIRKGEGVSLFMTIY